MTPPLHKIRVLDFSHLLSGELCSTILTDLGCEVIRVEPLTAGLGQQLPPIVKGESLYYWALHRNQRRINLNLKKPAAIKIAKQLAAESDIVLENFRPAVMERLGIGYEQLARGNRGLIYCSITGYGHTSKWKQRPGHDLNYVAETGILGLNRDASGQPVLPSVLVSDYLTGIYAALAITAALFEKQKTGQGKRIDMSMFECALSTLNLLATRLLYTGHEPHQGSLSSIDQPNYNVYRCRDGRFIAVASLEPKFWEILCRKVNRPDLIARCPVGADPELKQELSTIFASESLSDWINIFEGSDCCVSPVLKLDEALSHLPSTEREVITNIAHPLLGSIPQLRTPIPYLSNGGDTDKPMLDSASDTASILKALGYKKPEIEELNKQQVVVSK